MIRNVTILSAAAAIVFDLIACLFQLHLVIRSKSLVYILFFNMHSR